MYILLSLAAILFVLVGNELLWRRRNTHKEHSRKTVHILVGSFVAFWPLFMSWTDIRIISVAFLLAVIASKLLNIFASIHEVERFTLGEVSFALAVGGVTFVTKSDWIYAAAILQMGLADGLAAIAGTHFGENNSYKVFGFKKSIAGSLTFLIVSLAVIFISSHIAGNALPWQTGVLAALSATLLEIVAVWGLDNLLLPLVTALILMHP